MSVIHPDIPDRPEPNTLFPAVRSFRVINWRWSDISTDRLYRMAAKIGPELGDIFLNTLPSDLIRRLIEIVISKETITANDAGRHPDMGVAFDYLRSHRGTVIDQIIVCTGQEHPDIFCTDVVEPKLGLPNWNEDYCDYYTFAKILIHDYLESGLLLPNGFNLDSIPAPDLMVYARLVATNSHLIARTDGLATNPQSLIELFKSNRDRLCRHIHDRTGQNHPACANIEHDMPMPNDAFDQAFINDWDAVANVTPKKKERSTETEMSGYHSIHEMIVFRDFNSMVIPPDSRSGWRDTDKTLFDLGVRVGQEWGAPGTIADKSSMVPIGYHKKGFIWVRLLHKTKAVMPEIYHDRNIGKRKSALANGITAETSHIASTVRSKFLDINGLALPGREVDVSLAGLRIKPMFWHDPQLGRNFFVSVCNSGHYVFSEKPIALGCQCSQQCIDSKHSDAAKSLFEYIILSAMASDQLPRIRKMQFTLATMPNRGGAYAPYVIVASIAETKRLTSAFKSGKRPSWLKMHQDGSKLEQVARTFSNEKLNSGDVLPIRSEETGESAFAKIHRRACGYYHFEISPIPIFTGQSNWRCINSLLRSSALHIGGEGHSLPLSQEIPMVRCPVCNSEDPILIIGLQPPGQKTRRLLIPLTPKDMRPSLLPSKGDIVIYNKKIYIVDDNRKDTFAPIQADDHNISLISSSGRKIVKSMRLIRIIDNPREDIRRMFYDDDGLLIHKKIGITSWMKAITVGSTLVAMRGPLVNREVSCTSEPFKVGNDWRVHIAESDMTMSLFTDLRTRNTFPVTEGTTFIEGRPLIPGPAIAHARYAVAKIEDGTVILTNSDSENIRMSKLGLDLMLSRNILTYAKRTNPWTIAVDTGLLDKETTKIDVVYQNLVHKPEAAAAFIKEDDLHILVPF